MRKTLSMGVYEDTIVGCTNGVKVTTLDSEKKRVDPLYKIFNILKTHTLLLLFPPRYPIDSGGIRESEW